MIIQLCMYFIVFSFILILQRGYPKQILAVNAMCIYNAPDSPGQHIYFSYQSIINR